MYLSDSGKAWIGSLEVENDCQSDLLGIEAGEQRRLSQLSVGGEKDTSLGRVFAPTERSR